MKREKMEIINQYLLENRHFREYTLSKENVTQIWIASVLFWISASIIAIRACGNNRRRLAWSISLINSASMMAVGIVYSIIKYNQYPNFFDIPVDPNSRALIHSVNNFSVIVCIWFALANIFDIVVGVLFYREHLDPLTAYVHHTVALWITYACTTGDGLFTPVEPFASLFMTLMLVEIPTFLLALGAVFPAFRTDVGFGVTFFIFRLVFLAIMIYYAHLYRAGTAVFVLGYGFMMLHCFWFYNWVTKYGKKLFSKTKEEKEAKKHT